MRRGVLNDKEQVLCACYRSFFWAVPCDGPVELAGAEATESMRLRPGEAHETARFQAWQALHQAHRHADELRDLHACEVSAAQPSQGLQRIDLDRSPP